MSLNLKSSFASPETFLGIAIEELECSVLRSRPLAKAHAAAARNLEAAEDGLDEVGNMIVPESKC